MADYVPRSEPAPAPTDDVLRWVRGAVPGAPEVLSVRRMGVDSTTLDAIDLKGWQLVLRRYHDRVRLREDPWYRPENEATALRLLDGVDLPTPRLLAADLAADPPTLLTTRAAGVPMPDPEERVLRALADALATLHQADIRRPADLATYGTYYDPDVDGDRTVPAWSTRQRVWERVFEQIARPAPDGDTGFIHRDYHPGQSLWTRGELTGLVDWTTACWGPRAIDLARMRLNLVGDHGPHVAARFREWYRVAAGRDGAHPHWDLVDLADGLLDHPEPVDREAWRSWERLEDWASAALADLGNN